MIPTTDPFGDVLDVDTVEQAVRSTLQAWLPAGLAHQERRRGLTAGTLPQPRSWPLVSEFDLEVHEQLPAVVVVSPGSAGGPETVRGGRRKAWRFEVAVAIGGKDEREARRLASMYLAALTDALDVRDVTLGGIAEKARNVGPDDLAYGTTERGRQIAIYGTAFEVTVRQHLTTTGLADPPEDPYHPDPIPLGPTDAVIDVTYLQETPTS